MFLHISLVLCVTVYSHAKPFHNPDCIPCQTGGSSGGSSYSSSSSSYSSSAGGGGGHLLIPSQQISYGSYGGGLSSSQHMHKTFEQLKNEAEQFVSKNKNSATLGSIATGSEYGSAHKSYTSGSTSISEAGQFGSAGLQPLKQEHLSFGYTPSTKTDTILGQATYGQQQILPQSSQVVFEHSKKVQSVNEQPKYTQANYIIPVQGENVGLHNTDTFQNYGLHNGNSQQQLPIDNLHQNDHIKTISSQGAFVNELQTIPVKSVVTTYETKIPASSSSSSYKKEQSSSTYTSGGSFPTQIVGQVPIEVSKHVITSQKQVVPETVLMYTSVHQPQEVYVEGNNQQNVELISGNQQQAIQIPVQKESSSSFITHSKSGSSQTYSNSNPAPNTFVPQYSSEQIPLVNYGNGPSISDSGETAIKFVEGSHVQSAIIPAASIEKSSSVSSYQKQVSESSHSIPSVPLSSTYIKPGTTIYTSSSKQVPLSLSGDLDQSFVGSGGTHLLELQGSGGQIVSGDHYPGGSPIGSYKKEVSKSQTYSSGSPVITSVVGKPERVTYVSSGQFPLSGGQVIEGGDSSHSFISGGSSHSYSSSGGSRYNEGGSGGYYSSGSIPSGITDTELLKKLAYSSGQQAGISSFCNGCVPSVTGELSSIGHPEKKTYGVSTSFMKSSQTINGQTSENRKAAVAVNDNGNIKSYESHS